MLSRDDGGRENNRKSEQLHGATKKRLGKKGVKRKNPKEANLSLKGPAAEVGLDFDIFIGLCGFLVRICEELLEMVVEVEVRVGGERGGG